MQLYYKGTLDRVSYKACAENLPEQHSLLYDKSFVQINFSIVNKNWL